MNTARVVPLAEALAVPVVAVPVVVDETGVHLAASLPERIGEISLPRSFDETWCRSRGLSASAGSSVVLSASSGALVVLVSVGTSYGAASDESFRLAGASLASRAKAAGASAALLVPTDVLDDPARAAEGFVTGALLASYDFKRPESAEEVVVAPVGAPLPSVADHDAVTRGVQRAGVVSDATNWAKRLIDTPAGQATPKELAKRFAHRLGAEPDTGVEIWTESTIREEGLGGLLGVGAGSAEPTRLVYARYRPADARTHVVLVGKGVTFDSGGLSLKPAESMMTMKTDMSGAAIVMAALSVAARLRLPLRVTAIAALTENLTGDRATKPGDVVTARNGTTIEILNTDAEGRVILADALSLAVEANPDVIIDVATLTGAQRVALGDEVGGLFATTDELATQLIRAGEVTGESLWRLPLVDSYERQLESDVADLRNIGKGGGAGSITAALFLRRFVGDRPWAHLDIAGPGRSDQARGYVTKGATAFGARTLVQFLEGAVRDEGVS